MFTNGTVAKRLDQGMLERLNAEIAYILVVRTDTHIISTPESLSQINGASNTYSEKIMFINAMFNRHKWKHTPILVASERANTYSLSRTSWRQGLGFDIERVIYAILTCQRRCHFNSCTSICPY